LQSLGKAAKRRVAQNVACRALAAIGAIREIVADGGLQVCRSAVARELR
jgi:riboflavin biosynthesis pyrimidine reductase